MSLSRPQVKGHVIDVWLGFEDQLVGSFVLVLVYASNKLVADVQQHDSVREESRLDRVLEEDEAIVDKVLAEHLGPGQHRFCVQ